MKAFELLFYRVIKTFHSRNGTGFTEIMPRSVLFTSRERIIEFIAECRRGMEETTRVKLLCARRCDVESPYICLFRNTNASAQTVNAKDFSPSMSTHLTESIADIIFN